MRSAKTTEEPTKEKQKELPKKLQNYSGTNTQEEEDMNESDSEGDNEKSSEGVDEEETSDSSLWFSIPAELRKAIIRAIEGGRIQDSELGRTVKGPRTRLSRFSHAKTKERRYPAFEVAPNTE